MLTDLHMHLADDDEPLGDAELDPAHVRRYTDAAGERGIAAIGITEHVYRFAVARDWVDHPRWRKTAVADIDRYVGCLRAAQDEGLPVLIGLEVDHAAGAVDAARALAGRPEWDYLLGSVHWLGDLQVDHPRNRIWDHVGVREGWERYVEAVCDAAETGSFDVMSHPDLAKVFGHRPEPKPLDLYARLADCFAAAGVCAEVSTAGYRRALGEIYPDPELLAMFARRGIPVTLSSDAHAPAGIGLHYDRARRVLHEAGYRTITLFSRRERRQVPLG